MEDARKAHHIRWPLLSQGTSEENGMMTFIFDMWMDGSGLNFFDILGLWSSASALKQSTQLGFRRFGDLRPAPPVNHLPPLCLLIWLH
ncbi:hypothetical protein VZT92_011804 [Zoarces viviparus]